MATIDIGARKVDTTRAGSKRWALVVIAVAQLMIVLDTSVIIDLERIDPASLDQLLHPRIDAASDRS